MRQHEINKRKKLKQKCKESSKSQVEKNITENSKVREDRKGSIPFLHTCGNIICMQYYMSCGNVN